MFEILDNYVKIGGGRYKKAGLEWQEFGPDSVIFTRDGVLVGPGPVRYDAVTDPDTSAAFVDMATFTTYLDANFFEATGGAGGGPFTALSGTTSDGKNGLIHLTGNQDITFTPAQNRYSGMFDVVNDGAFTLKFNSTTVPVNASGAHGGLTPIGWYRISATQVRFIDKDGYVVTVAVSGVNTAPEAQTVAISGTAVEGQTLTGSFNYHDADGDLQGTSLREWRRADDNSGTNEAAITGATGTTYILQTADVGKYIRFAVTPKALAGVLTGAKAYSAYTAAVTALGANLPPVASSVTISNNTVQGQTITGSYTYSDPESDPAGTPIYKWYRADDNSGTNELVIAGQAAATYTTGSGDLGKYIRRSVTPVATAGAPTGTEAFSPYIGPITAPVVASGPQIIGAAINALNSGARNKLLITFDEYLAMSFTGDGGATAWAPSLTTPTSAYTVAGTGGSSGYSGTVTAADIVGVYRANGATQQHFFKVVELTMSAAFPAGFAGTVSLNGSTGLSSKATSDPVTAHAGITIQDFQQAVTGTQSTLSFDDSSPSDRIELFNDNPAGGFQGGGAAGAGKYYTLSESPFVNAANGFYAPYDNFIGSNTTIKIDLTYGLQTLPQSLAAADCLAEIGGLVVGHDAWFKIHTGTSTAKTVTISRIGGSYLVIDCNGVGSANTTPNAYAWD